MDENGSALVVQAYSLPGWLKAKIEEEARRNERAASAELRVRLAASFGMRTDGTPLAERSSAIKAGGEANGGPGDEA